MNLNRQGKLYFHGMKPVFKTVPSKEGWKKIPGKVDFRVSFKCVFKIRKLVLIINIDIIYLAFLVLSLNSF